MSKEGREAALVSLHYTYPAIVFLYFAVATAVAACTLQTKTSAAKAKHARSKIIIGLLLLFLTSYLGQLVSKIVEVLIKREWPAQDTTVGLLSCILVFGIQHSTLGDASDTVWYPFYGSWFIALAFEPILLVLSILTTGHGTFLRGSKVFLWIDFAIVMARVVILLAAILVYVIWREKAEEAGDAERTPLISKPDQRSNNGDESTDSGYGTNSESNTEATNSPSDAESPWERQEREGREQIEKRLKDEGNWIAYAKGFMIFFPYVWPVHNRRLQIHAGLVGVCLLIGNALNVLIPRQMGLVLDTLGAGHFNDAWVQVIVLAGLRLAASEAGVQFVRQMLWLPVEYYASESLTVAAYSHVMNLSSEFHDSKSSSDLIVAISHGQSISSMLESICFDALPMLVDLVAAFIYLSVKFGPYEGFITVATGMAFIRAATWMVARVKDKRKTMVKTFFEEHYHRQAGIQGWQTVSAFNQIPYEEDRYATAAKNRNSSMMSLIYGYSVGHAFQYLILLSGLIAGSFLAVYQVQTGRRTAGDFAMLLTYWAQLTGPLKFFANLGKSITQDLVYAERLLDVMLTKPTVADKPDAKPLDLKGGKVEFRNVSFSYDKKKGILKGVKLSVLPGTTVAFVGATGAGKSTILKLLDRFYDVTGGAILIDGQDIRDVQLSSVRQSIGIVPQSPVLFDDTIMNNIRYARLEASDEEVYAACKAAAIHDHIMTFTDGYKTRVGERGVKLSGGELQRIAIARAILKRPEIVLLDEATSSVDTDTEQKIQSGLRVLCEDRTTFIVAHRLSTVMNADVIFVVSGGEVVEQGSHEELIEKNGKYSELWSKQIFVKAEDTKNSQENITQTQSAQSSGSRSDDSGTSDDQPQKAPSANASRRQASTPKLDTNVAIKASDQVVKTPNGHKKESSRLNPGAREFTPRSAASPKRVDESTTRSDWADDVEAHVAEHDSPTIQAASAVQVSPACPSPTRGVVEAEENILVVEAEENTKPVGKTPEADIITVAYRYHEPQSTKRSVSDPVAQQTPTPSTPTKTAPAPPEEPLGQNVNSVKASTQKPTQHTNSGSSTYRQNRGGRKSSKVRGGRGRNSNNDFYTKRGGPGRSTSNPHNTNPHNTNPHNASQPPSSTTK